MHPTAGMGCRQKMGRITTEMGGGEQQLFPSSCSVPLVGPFDRRTNRDALRAISAYLGKRLGGPQVKLEKIYVQILALFGILYFL